MLSPQNHSQLTSHNNQVLFLPLTDTQILALKGRYQDSLPIKITKTVAFNGTSPTQWK